MIYLWRPPQYRHCHKSTISKKQWVKSYFILNLNTVHQFSPGEKQRQFAPEQNTEPRKKETKKKKEQSNQCDYGNYPINLF